MLLKEIVYDISMLLRINLIYRYFVFTLKFFNNVFRYLKLLPHKLKLLLHKKFKD